uniref:Uncharacterized protein n=1 Tax=Triticum urartu TaxID=4572 RepID=A0A8R7QJA2_TRIUA
MLHISHLEKSLNTAWSLREIMLLKWSVYYIKRNITGILLRGNDPKWTKLHQCISLQKQNCQLLGH